MAKPALALAAPLAQAVARQVHVDQDRYFALLAQRLHGHPSADVAERVARRLRSYEARFGVVRPTVATIAREIKRKERQTARGFALLKKVGALEVLHHGGKNRGANVYRLLPLTAAPRLTLPNSQAALQGSPVLDRDLRDGSASAPERAPASLSLITEEPKQAVGQGSQDHEWITPPGRQPEPTPEQLALVWNDDHRGHGEPDPGTLPLPRKPNPNKLAAAKTKKARPQQRFPVGGEELRANGDAGLLAERERFEAQTPDEKLADDAARAEEKGRSRPGGETRARVIAAGWRWGSAALALWHDWTHERLIEHATIGAELRRRAWIDLPPISASHCARTASSDRPVAA